MELLESGDPKSKLLRKAASQKQAMAEEINFISDKTEKIVKNALLIGGTLAASYMLYNMLSSSDSKKKRKKIKVVHATKEEDTGNVIESEPGVVAKIGTVLASQASVFLLSLAKEKLAEYLEKRAGKKDGNTL